MQVSKLCTRYEIYKKWSLFFQKWSSRVEQTNLGHWNHLLGFPWLLPHRLSSRRIHWLMKEAPINAPCWHTYFQIFAYCLSRLSSKTCCIVTSCCNPSYEFSETDVLFNVCQNYRGYQAPLEFWYCQTFLCKKALTLSLCITRFVVFNMLSSGIS